MIVSCTRNHHPSSFRLCHQHWLCECGQCL
nr:MAG TPA: hypothetical protein [Caudoviricetes sp.]DAY53488.1 MAG TPA: hypothetical protein [Caudoviricetes sp.]